MYYSAFQAIFASLIIHFFCVISPFSTSLSGISYDIFDFALLSYKLPISADDRSSLVALRCHYWSYIGFINSHFTPYACFSRLCRVGNHICSFFGLCFAFFLELSAAGDVNS